ncbi:3-hydroxyacyl-ACP dehydratase FabZ family protein [Collimonas humicola]|uniref:3-hydroxyacyl-ACP dehydratase FabZ family protein n=1 Tax=Collimonas humicola TaxID=2825886 RepID=UPI001B8AE4CE|nr:3-hydroxyacyl-ACP dehydratase FabZ family protein [Collimonas humicola]
MAESFDRAEIEALLPHRSHALFIADAVVDGAQVSGHAGWEVSHPHLSGHFPGNPIVPGVFLIEAGAQLAGVWIAAGNRQQAGLGMLAGVKRVLIHKPVVPGDRLSFELTVSHVSANFFDAAGVAVFADGAKAITLRITIAVLT